jgi:predicted ABC-type ATPase
VLAKMRIESEEAKLKEDSSVFKQEIQKVENIKEYVKDIENHIKDAQDWLEDYRTVKKRGDDALWDYAKYLATTMNLVMRKPTDKQGRKIYDNHWSDAYKEDKNPSDVSYPRKPYWFEDFNKAQRGLVRAYDSFLRPKNLTLNNLDGYVKKAEKEIEILEAEILKIGDDKNIERMAREIEQERAEKHIVPKTLPEVVDLFKSLNDECLGSRSLFQKIGDAKPMFTTCPPLDANGKGLITPDAVKYLESCIAKDSDTKLLHSNPLPDGSAKYHPYREALHDDIIDILLKRAQCVKGNTAPIAVLTGGAPASGKTRWLKNYAPYIKDFVLHIDADEIRSALPEYKGWNANSTFNEAKDIVNKLLDKVGTPCTQDILYDGTMGNSEKYFKLVNKLKKMGYKVFVAFMDVPEAVAQERALERYQKYGRYVSHNVISSFFREDDAGKPTLKQLKGNVDGYIVVDGITGEVKEQGGIEIPQDRPYLKAITSGLKDLKSKMDDAIAELKTHKEEAKSVVASNEEVFRVTHDDGYYEALKRQSYTDGTQPFYSVFHSQGIPSHIETEDHDLRKIQSHLKRANELDKKASEKQKKNPKVKAKMDYVIGKQQEFIDKLQAIIDKEK